MGLGDEDIDAIAFLPDGRLLVSVDDDFKLNRNGVGEVDDTDILVFTPSSLDANTSGTWALYFDGSTWG